MAALRVLCREAWSGGEAEEGLAVSGDGEDAPSVLGALGLSDPATG
jgi:hypothetical protein